MSKTIAVSASMQDHKERIIDRLKAETDASRETVKCIIASAKALQRAKDGIGERSWMKVFDDDLAEYGMNYKKAQRYLTILNNPFLTDAKNWDYLPASYSTLSLLAGVPYKKLYKLLDKGALDYTITASDARHLLSSSQPKAIEDKSSKEDEEVADATKGKTKKTGKDILASFAESLENLQDQLDEDFDLKDFESALRKFFDKYAKENG